MAETWREKAISETYIYRKGSGNKSGLWSRILRLMSAGIAGKGGENPPLRAMAVIEQSRWNINEKDYIDY
ncbi:hypothetical protein DGMP_35310 [Desulfomarina profundi]|uniref:Uncharacterized protein n=1 Tax=Desulfomarina profundi TaxID=2772557 RepID=A0A8D5JEQ9_9BACT|nr:hypothetical protein DGMP_35310 [Desulfomarina profundi]